MKISKLNSILLFLFVFTLFSFIPGPEKEYRVLKNTSFSRGEKMSFRLHYGIFNAGRADFEVHPDLYKVNNRTCNKITVFGRSVGAFEMIVNIRDTWGSYMDTTSLISQRSYRDIKENNYVLKEYVNFFPLEGRAHVERHRKGIHHNDYQIPNNIHDIISGFYFLRTINYNELKVGTIIKIDAFFENELYDFTIRYDGLDNVKTKFGKTKAIKLTPIMPENSLFEGKNSITCWLSNDENRMPLKVRAKMFVGSVDIDLESFSGLRNPSCFKR
jgi:hypothetical protein